MNKLQQENKELWQQLQFLESALLKGNLNDGMTPENLVLPPVFGMRGTANTAPASISSLPAANVDLDSIICKRFGPGIDNAS